MIRLTSISNKRKRIDPLPAYIDYPLQLLSPMPSMFLEYDGDIIYEELEEDMLEEVEDEYREDKMDQMISKYSY